MIVAYRGKRSVFLEFFLSLPYLRVESCVFVFFPVSMTYLGLPVDV